MRRLAMGLAAVLLLAGCATTAPDTRDEIDTLELAIEQVDGVEGAKATGHPAGVGLTITMDPGIGEEEYRTLLRDVVDVWNASSIGERRRLGLNATPEGTFSFSNLDPDDLTNVLAAARILHHFGPDHPARIGTAANGKFLVADELFLLLEVDDEAQVAPTLAELEQLVQESGLRYRPGGLAVEVR